MKKRFFVKSFVLILFIAVILTACTAKPKEFTLDDVYTLMDEPTKAFADSMTHVKTAIALKEYEIEPDLVKNAVFLRSEDSADELIIIEVSGQGAIEDIKTFFAAIQQEKYHEWEKGDADEFAKVKNYKTAVKDKYMLYVVADDSAAVLSCFEGIFD